MNVIESLLNWANSFFVKKPKLVIIPRRNITSWVDAQYKPIFNDKVTELNVLLAKCLSEDKTLESLIQKMSSHQPKNLRIDILTKVISNKNILLKASIELHKHLQTAKNAQSLHQIESFFEQLQNQNENLLKIRAQTSHILMDNLEEYKHIMHVCGVLNSIGYDAITTFENAAPYLHAIRQARKIELSLEKEKKVKENMFVVSNAIKIIKNEIADIEEEIGQMRDDPKYKLEKSGMASRLNKNVFSYTDLEIQKKQKLIDELMYKLKIETEKRHHLDHEMISINREGHEQSLKKQILEDFFVEVRFNEKA
jgi:hypothetical protein